MQWLLQIGFEIGFELFGGESETEGMPAAKANVFRPLTAGVVDRDVVTKHHTTDGMPDHFESCLWFKERVPASTCVFSCLRVFFDDVNAMAQEPAEVTNFLLEFVMSGISVGT